MRVNIYKNVRDTKGATANLFTILTTDKWRTLSDKVRAEKDDDKRKELKLQLPAFTPSGTFTTRNIKGLIKHSGYMCIDIDGDDNPTIKDWQAVVHQLGKLPEVAFAGLSVSGNGVFALIPIKYPDRHIAHFRALQKSLSKRGLVIDPKCSDVSRLRFYSYNKHYYINKDAKQYTPLYNKPQALQPTYTHIPLSNSMPSDESDAEALVKEVVARGVNIVPNYNDWFKVGAALSNVSNGRQLFHNISQIDSNKYNYKECNKQFDSIKPGGGITINTLFYIANQYGVVLRKSKHTSSFHDISNPKRKPKNQLFADWKRCEKTIVQAKPLPPNGQLEEPKPTDKILNCYVDKDGEFYISNPNGDDTFSVHKSMEQSESGKGLATIIY